MSLIKHHMDLKNAWELVFDQLEQASKDPDHAFRYLTMATLSKEKAPAQRMVVLREFSKDDVLITVFTDARSKKVEEIKNNDSVSLLFYDPEEKLQVSIKGKASLLTENHKKMKYWNESGSHGAHSYTAHRSPGEVIQDPSEAYDWDLESSENFCVIMIKAESMKFLQLNGHRHLRAIQSFSEGSRKRNWIAP